MQLTTGPGALRSEACSGYQTAGTPSVHEQAALVVSNTPVNSEYRHMVVSLAPGSLVGSAGQFFHILCPNSSAGSPYLRRPMSIYGNDQETASVEFLYKVAGVGTTGLSHLRSGDTVNILGPLGIGFRLEASWRSIVLVGRGVGLATLAPLASMARRHGVSVTAILSVRRSDLVMSVEVLESHGAEVMVLQDEDGTSSLESVELLIRTLISSGRADAFFTCGSRRLTSLLQSIGRTFQIPGQVAVEEQMACGLGMCFCCVKPFNVNGAVHHRRVCVEGPVFDLQEVIA
jgi:dihydroorotate dehydrogenase electron transfer subunit